MARLLNLKLNLQKEQEKLKKLDTHLIKQQVDEHDIAAVLARWTKIPAEKLQASESEKLLHMQETLKRACYWPR